MAVEFEDREIRAPRGPVEVTIPVHPQGGAQRRLRLRLLGEGAEGYGVWQKRMPEALPQEYEGRPITWFNNFGLKRAGNDAYEARIPEGYTIALERPEPKFSGFFVYYDPQSDPPLNRVETREVGDQFEATLYGGDPAVGWAS